MNIKLIANSGPGRGQALDVAGKLFIGRDSHCQVRPRIEGLAGIHTLIEARDGHVFVRDCGDTMDGTTINDRTIHTKEVVVFDGDRISIGDVDFTLRIAPRDLLDVSVIAEAPEGWPAVVASTTAGDETAELELPAVVHKVVALTTSPEGAITYEAPAPGSTLIVHFQAADLNDERTVAPLRSDLAAISDLNLPKNVVVDMGNVSYISSRAVGVILAYYQRIDREGGAMRACRVDDKVQPILHQMRLDRLIDLYETVEEAVNTPWD